MFCSFFRNMDYYGLIDYIMTFSSYKEYKETRDMIKEKYNTYDDYKKKIYKMYVFSRPLLNENQKNKISRILNFEEHEETIIEKDMQFNNNKQARFNIMNKKQKYNKYTLQQKIVYKLYSFSRGLGEKQIEEFWNIINGVIDERFD